ncbi:putative cytochrome p450 [Phaeomoniella chlamydospora]|uniref:Putative cytochrome p450 n=1 Tax=Phaeomoniella chlamydospora TaxID=158046 RepID=A0A0G2GIM7_PHACM|nr:putative cytochrome p450 [Phaeomoniella chlamydospora]
MSAPRSPYTRAIWYEGMRLDPKINNVISERSEKRHNALRAKMAMGYSGKENPLLEKSIDNRIQDMINLIRKKYISEGTQYRPLDFAVIAQYFTMDVLTDVAFGEPFGYLKNDKDMYDYIKTIRGFMPVLELQTNSPLTNYIMSSRVVKALLAPTAKDLTGMGPVIRIAQEVVRERFGPNKIEREDMLGSFVRHGLTQQEAESESLLQIMAGADSTATAIRSTLLYIISHPRVYNKLQAEIDEAERNGAISNPITNNEAKNLPYLQAVIKEGLRIFPPLTGLMTKLVPPEGDTINGQFIPGGTEIGYNAWGTHHRKETFGEDAILFRPERWLEADPDQLRAMENSNELVFGSGRYKCLGHPVAHIELNKTFLQLLRTFDFQLADPIKPFSTRCNGIHIQQFMWVRVSERVKAK